MRTMKWEKEKTGVSTQEKQWHYALLIEDIDAEGFHCESYGIMITDPDTGKQTTARHITVNASWALALLTKIARLSVSPVTLGDVVEDLLGE